MWCTGDESSLEQCSSNTLSTSSYSYYSSPVVSVICQGNITSQPECSSGDLRLVGGERESEGRVEICVEGFWGTVCDSGWSQREALVVCKQSGFEEKGRNVFFFLNCNLYNIPVVDPCGDPMMYTHMGELVILNCRSHILYWCLLW